MKVQSACHRIREDPEWGSILNFFHSQRGCKLSAIDPFSLENVC